MSCRAVIIEIKFNFRSKMPIFGLKRVNGEIRTGDATLNLTKFKPKSNSAQNLTIIWSKSTSNP